MKMLHPKIWRAKLGRSRDQTDDTMMWSSIGPLSSYFGFVTKINISMSKRHIGHNFGMKIVNVKNVVEIFLVT